MFLCTAVEISVAAHDTTGGMETKILEAAVIARLGIDVYITKVRMLGSIFPFWNMEMTKFLAFFFWMNMTQALFRPCLLPKKFCKIFQILRHIESLDACMEY